MFCLPKYVKLQKIKLCSLSIQISKNFKNKSLKMFNFFSYRRLIAFNSSRYVTLMKYNYGVDSGYSFIKNNLFKLNKYYGW